MNERSYLRNFRRSHYIIFWLIIAWDSNIVFSFFSFFYLTIWALIIVVLTERLQDTRLRNLLSFESLWKVVINLEHSKYLYIVDNSYLVSCSLFVKTWWIFWFIWSSLCSVERAICFRLIFSRQKQLSE